MRYVDFHCHSAFYTNNECIEIISIDPTRCKPSSLYTIGYHPWWSDKHLERHQITFLEDCYRTYNSCLAIGECGLDKLQGASETIQISNFEKQIEIANELNAPVIIHCVRKYHTLLSIHKNMAMTPWIIHGFKRNKTLSKTLLDQNIYLSIAPYENMNAAFLDTIKYIPIHKLFIETDSDRRLGIMERYKILADYRNISLDDLKVQIYKNCKDLFGEKWLKLIG